MIKKWVVECICLFLVVLFVYTGLSKFADFSEFSAAIGKSPMLAMISNWISYAVPLTEIVLALLLVIPKTRLVALYGSFSLMLMFSIYIYLMIYYSDYRPCTCGGIIQEMSWTAHLYFNIGTTLMTLIAILLEILPSRGSYKRFGYRKPRAESI